ncbi:MAG: hypothetical protein LQ343_005477 [Gyalolechia ehrenbergii]|nr:MAG: hypothetical protein LQ343_005477 [Gyalolechia ehrenbergii]
MRVLGDEYVKSEFRAHRNVENPIHIVGFLKEWQMYAQQVEGDSWYGEKLDTEKIDKMNDDDVPQVQEAMVSTGQALRGGDEYEQLSVLRERQGEKR